jgi:hypothetical protein
MDYKKNNMGTGREKGRGAKRARVTRGIQSTAKGSTAMCTLRYSIVVAFI